MVFSWNFNNDELCKINSKILRPLPLPPPFPISVLSQVIFANNLDSLIKSENLSVPGFSMYKAPPSLEKKKKSFLEDYKVWKMTDIEFFTQFDQEHNCFFCPTRETTRISLAGSHVCEQVQSSGVWAQSIT